jgi:hypothetical protein
VNEPIRQRTLEEKVDHLIHQYAELRGCVERLERGPEATALVEELLKLRHVRHEAAKALRDIGA